MRTKCEKSSKHWVADVFRGAELRTRAILRAWRLVDLNRKWLSAAVADRLHVTGKGQFRRTSPPTLAGFAPGKQSRFSSRFYPKEFAMNRCCLHCLTLHKLALCLGAGAFALLVALPLPT